MPAVAVIVVVHVIYIFSTLFINMEYNFFNIKFNLNIIVWGYEWENEEKAERRQKRRVRN